MITTAAAPTTSPIAPIASQFINLVLPSNGTAAQLRATAPLQLDRSDHVRRQTLPEVDWNALWLVSCSGLLGGVRS